MLYAPYISLLRYQSTILDPLGYAHCRLAFVRARVEDAVDAKRVSIACKRVFQPGFWPLPRRWRRRVLILLR